MTGMLGSAFKREAATCMSRSKSALPNEMPCGKKAVAGPASACFLSVTMKVTISANRRHFTDDSGRPWFFLADTAWNGALKATAEEWDRYLRTRARQGFSAIQFVVTHWRGAAEPIHGRTFEEVDGRIVEHAAALERMDACIQRIVDFGMVPVPVMFWTNNPAPMAQAEDWMQSPACNPYFSEPAMIDAGRAMLARWQHHEPIWLLGGDGDYRGRRFAEMWKRVGRAVFSEYPDAVASMHSCGTAWTCDVFADEPWFNLALFQSGHGALAGDLRCITDGPFSKRWAQLEMPFMNVEPNYENALSYQTKVPFSPALVRRASYWSLLSAPTAGVTYGTTGIWAWLREQGEVAEGHGEVWVGGPWHQWLESEGIDSMIVLKKIFLSLPWHDLRPADFLIEIQPGYFDPAAYVKAAMTEDGSVVLIYAPCGGRLALQPTTGIRDVQAQWIDPRSGSRARASARAGDKLAFDCPDDRDWLLLIES